MEQVNNNNIEEKLSTLNSQLSTNIYPIFDRMMTREDKERLLKQRSVMVWFTGLSGSGKSTVAIALERELHKCGLLCRILDGDNIRSGSNNNLGFSAEDRVENIRRIAEVSKLFIDTGVITIAAFISPNNDLREMAASIVGKENFLEIYVSTPIEECERRDVKGLYAKARRGEIKDFTGTYSEYVAWKREYEAARHAQEAQARPKPQAVRTQAAETAPRKLSYNEKRELEMLEREIPVLEAEKAALEESLSSGSLGVDELTAQSQRIVELIGLIDEKTMRWLLLSER